MNDKRVETFASWMKFMVAMEIVLALLLDFHFIEFLSFLVSMLIMIAVMVMIVFIPEQKQEREK